MEATFPKCVSEQFLDHRHLGNDSPSSVVGRNGTNLAEKWADHAEALQGMLVDDFPNYISMGKYLSQKLFTMTCNGSFLFFYASWTCQSRCPRFHTRPYSEDPHKVTK
jgi:hypothetical protein